MPAALLARPDSAAANVRRGLSLRESFTVFALVCDRSAPAAVAPVAPAAAAAFVDHFRRRDAARSAVRRCETTQRYGPPLGYAAVPLPLSRIRHIRVASRSRRRTGKVGRAVARISETLRRPRLRVCPLSSKPPNLLRLLHLARFYFDGVAICSVLPVLCVDDVMFAYNRRARMLPSEVSA